VTNVSFECGSVADLNLDPQSYDVVLFLGVYHHLPPPLRWPAMMNLLGAARRQLVMRTPLLQPQKPARTTNIFKACEELNFTLTIYPHGPRPGGNILIAQRQTTPAP